MATYKISNVASELFLNIYGSNITELKDNQNVTQWGNTGATEQKWVLDADVFLYSGPIRSAVDTSFALNIYTATKNCDVYPISKNTESDYKVTTEFISGLNNTYYIKLAAHNLYLTAPSLSQGASIGWAEYAGTEDQQWVFEETDDVPVTPPDDTIDAWNWSDTAVNSMNNKGPVSSVTWQEWNSLCDKVQTCLDRAGESWSTYNGPYGSYTPTYENAKMSALDKTMTAARFNAVRGNIDSHVSTGISPVSPGDNVLGSYFTTIVNALNAWIDALNS